MARNIEISTKTLLVLFTLLLGLWFLLQISSIVLILFVSLILALGLAPLVDNLCQKGLHRSAAVLLVYLFFILILAALVTVALSPMISQTQRLIERLPGIAATLSLPGLEGFQQKFIDSVAQEISLISGNVLRVTLGVFSNALAVVTVLVLTFYFLVDFPKLKTNFMGLFSRKNKPKVEKAIEEIEHKIGSWLRGQLVLMFAVGLVTYIGLVLIGLDFALSLALIAGLLEIVPVIGPLVSAVPALLVAASVSPLITLLAALLYIIVQQLENSFLVPKVMEKAVGFSPIVVLIALLVGAKLLGVLGALLAVPITLMIFIVAKSALDTEWS